MVALLKVPPEGYRYDGKPIRPVTAWSYSAWSMYDKCPLQWYGIKVLGYPDPPSPALLKGRKVHKEAEDFLKNPRAALPKVLTRFETLATQLRTLSPYVELQLTFRSDWSLGREGWFGKDVWLRSAWDWGVHYPDRHLDLGDWKTGKRYSDNDEQLELFALTGFLKLPVDTVETRLWYLDSGLEVTETFHVKDKAALMSKWTARANTMLAPQTYYPKPNDKCSFCPLSSKHKGGPCSAG